MAPMTYDSRTSVRIPGDGIGRPFRLRLCLILV